jgi:hypothetical protein
MHDGNHPAYWQSDGQKIKEKWALPMHVSILSCPVLSIVLVVAFNAYCAAQSTFETVESVI